MRNFKLAHFNTNTKWLRKKHSVLSLYYSAWTSIWWTEYGTEKHVDSSPESHDRELRPHKPHCAPPAPTPKEALPCFLSHSLQNVYSLPSSLATCFTPCWPCIQVHRADFLLNSVTPQIQIFPPKLKHLPWQLKPQSWLIQCTSLTHFPSRAFVGKWTRFWS